MPCRRKKKSWKHLTTFRHFQLTVLNCSCDSIVMVSYRLCTKEFVLQVEMSVKYEQGKSISN
uniref:Uncharacterized protein n=1 Tax=Triticum urartu TaxID=4572 RepID=A0A8R7NXY2_TRIUA